MFPQLKIEVINLLIISALYSKDMSLFKAHAERQLSRQAVGQRQAVTTACAAEKSQLAELAFSVNSSTF